jgi:20S proteasome alpha/beta subunit
METVFGLVGDGFALVVTDTSAVQSIVVQKTDDDKIMVLDSHKLMGCTGEKGDRFLFLSLSLSPPSFFLVLLLISIALSRLTKKVS